VWKSDHEQIQTSLPLSADPAAGALTGIFVMSAVLAGPVGWVLALIAWAVMRRRNTEDRADAPSAR
jgi:hypothetical protein